MNTKLLMTFSAGILGLAGILLSFLPENFLNFLGIAENQTMLLLIQIIGALYFGFGMLNWMTRSSRIGGIYNRPIAVANFSHFLIAGLALLKLLVNKPDSANSIWATGVVYLGIATSYGLVLFRNPVAENKNKY